MQPLLKRLRRLFGRVLQGALLEDRHAPAESMEYFRTLPVASDISLEFLSPEVFVGPGSGCVAVAFMSVPEAAMDAHQRSSLGEHKVEGAGQSPHTNSISKAPSEKKGEKYLSRPGICSATTRHHAASLRIGRNAHGRKFLPLKCLLRWQLRASVWQCERMKATIEAEVGSLPCA